ncbi:MAG TPA: hypothetical protein PLB01_10245 [Thermoanaerobaculia bacterium]|nr:hypothetical protein [Thermoanaerobaculia bacterium]
MTVGLNSLRYRNAAREGFTKTSPEMLAKDAVVGKAGAAWTTRIQSAFSGKGSPESIAKALELVAEHELWEKGGIPEMAALKTLPLPIEEKLRRYCDRMFGLDCLGFVINYVQSQMNLLLDKSPLFADLHHFRTAPFTPRMTLLSFRMGDIVVWDEPPRHIALIGSLQNQTFAFRVPLVMSAADGNFGPAGLVLDDFTLKADGVPGSFTFVGKFDSQRVRVFGPPIPIF